MYTTYNYIIRFQEGSEYTYLKKDYRKKEEITKDIIEAKLFCLKEAHRVCKKFRERGRQVTIHKVKVTHEITSIELYPYDIGKSK